MSHRAGAGDAPELHNRRRDEDIAPYHRGRSKGSWEAPPAEFEIAHRAIPSRARLPNKSLAHSKLLHQIPFVNVGQIKQRLENGFKPFEIQLSNGRRIRVPHPDFIAVGKRTIAVIDENDLACIIDALHIVSIDDVPAKRRGR